MITREAYTFDIPVTPPPKSSMDLTSIVILVGVAVATWKLGWVKRWSEAMTPTQTQDGKA